MDADHAHFLEDRVDDAVFAYERARVRQRGTRGRAGRAGLDQYDRFATGARFLERPTNLRPSVMPSR